MVSSYHVSVLHMLGARPLLRAATSKSWGVGARNPQRMSPSRLASSWIQDVDEAHHGIEGRRLSGRIHILGLGNVGTFVAHSIASRPSRPPITLLLQSPPVYDVFVERNHALSVNSIGLDDNKTGFDVDVLSDGAWHSIPHRSNQGGTPQNGQHVPDGLAESQVPLASTPVDDEPIECLIVSVKAPVTVTALESVRHRLTPNSTILFLQNGMGIIDAVNAKVFPEPQQRPHYMLGIISHGLAQRSGRFHVTHTGMGTTILGPVPPQNPGLRSSTDKEPDWAPSTKYLLRTMTLTPPLVAVAEPPSSVTMHQLEKLAMNCVINPLTAIMDCRNGELLYNYSFTRIMRLLLFEISSVICSLPELQGIPGIESRFSPERLRWMVTQLAQKTAQNTSSMLQDVRANRTTEIEFLNGYIVRRGEELGIKCVVNYMIKHLILAKQKESRQKESSAIPIDLIEDDSKDSKL